MIAVDQAEGLRRWARSRGVTPVQRQRAERTLVVVGLSGAGGGDVDEVSRLLRHWAQEGRHWVGDPGDWRIVPMDVASPYIPVLANQQPRWGLWVEHDRQGFRRAFRQIQALAARGGPKRLLALHPPTLPRRGLLGNLQQAAADYFGTELLVLAR
ncbi:hypothetical protein [Parahaliea mediterranea]|uniref:Uncharacterized protein n=1 Tax=Parahaliea mediterranea TaxID=651086 RepID=A0A939DCU4_9GAMM|nr:hypothetical protein [Parahaliea mediterranea]MBN7795801.1 hypothetical protein [Parahaliea mediterranea]